MPPCGTPSGLPAWLQNAAPYEPPAVAPWPVEGQVPWPTIAAGNVSAPEEALDATAGVEAELLIADPGCSPADADTAAAPDTATAPDTAAEPDTATAPDTAADVGAGTGAADAGSVEPAFTSKLVRWSRHAAAGSVLSGIAGGLQRVFEPDERPAIVMEVPAPGPDDRCPVRLVFVPGDPKASMAFIRPWLLRTGWPPSR